MKGLHIFTAIAIATLLWGCSDDEPTYPTPVFKEVIAVVDDLSPATFSYYSDETSAPIGMVSQSSISGVDSGERVLIQYYTEIADTARRSVPISLKYAGKIVNGTATKAPMASILIAEPGQCEVISSWRSGRWLNMQLQLRYDGQPRGLTMVADSGTVGNDTIECYLLNPGNEIGDASVMRHTFASFDISGIISRQGQYIRIHEKN